MLGTGSGKPTSWGRSRTKQHSTAGCSLSSLVTCRRASSSCLRPWNHSPSTPSRWNSEDVTGYWDLAIRTCHAPPVSSVRSQVLHGRAGTYSNRRQPLFCSGGRSVRCCVLECSYLCVRVMLSASHFTIKFAFAFSIHRRVERIFLVCASLVRDTIRLINAESSNSFARVRCAVFVLGK